MRFMGIYVLGVRFIWSFLCLFAAQLAILPEILGSVAAADVIVRGN